MTDNTNDLPPENLTEKLSDMPSTDQVTVSSENETGESETGDNIQAASDIPKTDAEPNTKIDAKTVPDIDTPHD